MSNKVRVVTCISTTLRTASPLPSYYPRLVPHRRSSAAHDPNLPGCSKWFSTTSSILTIPQRTFFTSNHDSSPQPQSMNVSRPNSLIEPENEEDNRFQPDFPTPHHKSTPHLPLPPRLPYSPNSYPFKRHMEILSLSLYSTPDESWTVYTSLHPSLRQYIPDATFKSLISHQIDHTAQQKGWSRIKTLLKLAKKCGMSLGEIDQKDLIRIIRLGLRRFRAEYDVSRYTEGEEEEIHKLVRVLWTTLESKIPLRSFPHELKRGWLGLHYRRLQSTRRNTGQKNKGEMTSQMIEIEEMVLDMVRKKSVTTSLGYYIGEILVMSSGSSSEGLKQSLRNITWCIEQGVDIKMTHLHKVMRKLSKAEDGDGLEELVPSILTSLNIDPISRTSRILYQALDSATRRARTRVQKALEILENGEMNVGGLVGRGISVARSSQDDVVVRLDAAIRLLGLALQHKEGDCTALISSLTIGLYNAKRTSPSYSTPQEIDKLIIRYTKLLHESQITSQLPSESIIPLFRLILACLPSSEGYILSRKIYQYARSANPPFRWSIKNLFLWQKLFRHSLTSPNHHLHFASRLYSDLMADGMAIRKPDMLLFIRSIGMKSSPSRAILLERHIKDYLWSENYGRSLAPLVLALTQGLSTGGIQDTDLALNLNERILQGNPIPSEVIEIIVSNLSRSVKSQDRIKVLHLLQQVNGEDVRAIKIYNTVLSNLIFASSKRNDRQEEGESRLNHEETLGYAIHLYKEMISKSIKPNNRVVSNMIRILIDSDHLESALAVFDASVRSSSSSSSSSSSGFRIKSNVVGRLMINLAMTDRVDEAYRVEASWREVNGESEGRVWDKGAVGARMLVDIKSGREVDVEDVMRRTGWRGKKGFLTFLQSLKPPPPPRLDAQVEQDDRKSVVDLGSIRSCVWDDRRRREQNRVDSCIASDYGVVYH
ncbi:hypothetical protein I302_106784 [Kwoniella bestiolae CBS 10118]|uniref:Uncharacterized protein n=1 Tax=Kwoniella bestiolae CBS 10118 TaxID=1296100 RepID=A0A1B9G0E7_9TREE|nr:hypothetical protein I302_05951 [Kwoniella bestiolae CBS 10118]OCF24491.1 hypothetical protein I302_05951 [Kwoniella bestiolae CBS 10118]